MSTTHDTTTTVAAGLPVLVTYNATTGHWSAEVDLSEFATAVDELLEDGVYDNEDGWAGEVAALVQAWREVTENLVPVAVADIRFVPKGDA